MESERRFLMDVVVTVPKWFGLDTWIAEGDPVGVPWSGQEWHFYLGGPLPRIQPGERVYVVYNGALRGYAPLVRIDVEGWRYGLVRHGGAVAVSIPENIRGFRGFRYRWWDTALERPFPDWQDPEATLEEYVVFVFGTEKARATLRVLMPQCQGIVYAQTLGMQDVYQVKPKAMKLFKTLVVCCDCSLASVE
jgi:hypothetical protein